MRSVRPPCKCRQAVAAVIHSKQLGPSLGHITTQFRKQRGVRITPTGLVQGVHRAGRHAQRAYEMPHDTMQALRPALVTRTLCGQHPI
jgi:hypothetical protein